MSNRSERRIDIGLKKESIHSHMATLEMLHHQAPTVKQGFNYTEGNEPFADEYKRFGPIKYLDRLLNMNYYDWTMSPIKREEVDWVNSTIQLHHGTLAQIEENLKSQGVKAYTFKPGIIHPNTNRTMQIYLTVVADKNNRSNLIVSTPHSQRIKQIENILRHVPIDEKKVVSIEHFPDIDSEMNKIISNLDRKRVADSIVIGANHGISNLMFLLNIIGNTKIDNATQLVESDEFTLLASESMLKKIQKLRKSFKSPIDSINQLATLLLASGKTKMSKEDIVAQIKSSQLGFFFVLLEDNNLKRKLNYSELMSLCVFNEWIDNLISRNPKLKKLNNYRLIPGQHNGVFVNSEDFGHFELIKTPASNFILSPIPYGQESINLLRAVETTNVNRMYITGSCGAYSVSNDINVGDLMSPTSFIENQQTTAIKNCFHNDQSIQNSEHLSVDYITEEDNVWLENMERIAKERGSVITADVELPYLTSAMNLFRDFGIVFMVTDILRDERRSNLRDGQHIKLLRSNGILKRDLKIWNHLQSLNK